MGSTPMCSPNGEVGVIGTPSPVGYLNFDCWYQDREGSIGSYLSSPLFMSTKIQNGKK
jgi:hypothetical protein